MGAESEFTIDELARAAGTTVRSLRVYHERGVLPPPQVKGRTGYYSPEHLNRVKTIGRLLDRGIKLNGIRELLNAWDRGDGLAEVLGVIDEPAGHTEALTSLTSFTAETVSAVDLEQRYREVPDGVRRAVALGLYEQVDSQTYRVLNPRLNKIGGRLTESGLPMAVVLDELEQLDADCRRIAARHAELFRTLAWEPFQNSEQTQEDLNKVTEYLSTARIVPARAAAELVSHHLLQQLEPDITKLADTLGDEA